MEFKTCPIGAFSVVSHDSYVFYVVLLQTPVSWFLLLFLWQATFSEGQILKGGTPLVAKVLNCLPL